MYSKTEPVEHVSVAPGAAYRPVYGVQRTCAARGEAVSPFISVSAGQASGEATMQAIVGQGDGHRMRDQGIRRLWEIALVRDVVRCK
jgi:hypothetical protein